MITPKIAAGVYKSTILPLLDYGDILYDGTSQQLLNKLQILQNRAIRTICNPPTRTNTDCYHEQLRLLPLAQRRKIHITQLGYWLVNTESYIDNRQLPIRSHTSMANLLKVSRTKNHMCAKNYKHKAITYWNNVPPDIRNLVNKKKILNYLTSNAT